MRKLLLQNLLQSPLTIPPPPPSEAALTELAAKINRATSADWVAVYLFVKWMPVPAMAVVEIHALNNAFYDLERFGFHIVASPRHADVLLVTGPVTVNMKRRWNVLMPLRLI